MAIPALTDLRKDLKVSMSKTGAPFAEVGSFPAKILVQIGFVFLVRCCWWGRVVGRESVHALLAIVDVAEQVVVMVEEVCGCSVGRNSDTRYISYTVG